MTEGVPAAPQEGLASRRHRTRALLPQRLRRRTLLHGEKVAVIVR
jgi:hypothetical protein